MKEYLIEFGYTDEEINTLIEQGKIKVLDGEPVIVDPDLFTVFIIKMLDESINPIGYFEKEPNDNSLLYHVYKYIELRMFKEAELLLDKYIKENNNSLFAKMLYIGLDKLEDRTDYILDDTKYESEEMKKQLKKKELELLAAIELDHQKEGYKILQDLKSIYKYNQESLPLLIIDDFMMELRRLSTNHRRVSHHTDYNMTGDLDSVIMGLLKDMDYYRLDTFVKEELEGLTNPSVKYEIYHLFMEQLMYLNNKNLKYIKDTMKIDVESKSLSEVLRYNHLPRLDHNFIYDLTHPQKEEEPYINYYPIYEQYKKERNYVVAKQSLEKFNTQMKRRNIYKNIDYELNELDILIKNSNVDEETKSNMIQLEEESNTLIEAKEYEFAIDKLLELYNLGNIPNQFIYNKIGYCYYMNKQYPEAIDYYSKAPEGFISPDDIEYLIYSYFKVGKYEDALRLIPNYEMYYPDENVRLHYIESICHVKLKEFNEAYDSLESCEAMNVVYYNMPIAYNREKEIIDKIKNGKKIDCYSDEDFVSYELTEEETKLASEIAKNKVNLTSLVRSGDLTIHSLKDKIEYLMSCAKVYLQMGLEEEGTKLCKFINAMLQDPRLETKEKEVFTLRLKNYTTI